MPFKGTDRKAYNSEAVRKAKTPKAKSRAYYKEKAKNQKAKESTSKPVKSPNWSSSRPARRVPKRVVQPRARVVSNPKPQPVIKAEFSVVVKPKTIPVVNSFVDKQPFFSSAKKRTEQANTVVSKIKDYFVSKLVDAAEEVAKAAVRKVLSYYLPIDLIDKIEKTCEFIEKVSTYIKVGKKVYEVAIMISKKGKIVRVDTSYISIDSRNHTNYKSFYKNNLQKIRQLPDQINDEIEGGPMKYEVYYGKRQITEMELLQTFNNLKQAERFVQEQIKNKHTTSTYLRRLEDENVIWFDYGDHVNFYAISLKDA